VNFKHLAKALTEWLMGYRRLVIAGVGNTLRGDDGFGTELVKRLSGRTFKDVLILDCGTVPEAYVGPIRKFHPTHILVVDAADIGSKSGSVGLIFPDKITGLTISTHNLPLKVVTDYLAVQTSAKIALLTIQPKNIDFREGLSSVVETVLKRVHNVLLSVLE